MDDLTVDKLEYENFSKSVLDSFSKVSSYSCSSSDRVSPGDKLRADKQALMQFMEKEGFSAEEIALVVAISDKELVSRTKTVVDAAKKKNEEKNFEPTDKPSFYFVAGQPGCGKTGAIEVIEGSLEKTPFVSEMDVYRTKHPNINAIKEMIVKHYPDDEELQGKMFVMFTSYFADLLELATVSYMLSQGYSVVKETTGKNSQGICGMIEALQEYYPEMSANVACMAVAQDVSIDGTKTRGSTMKQLTGFFSKDLESSGIHQKPIGRGNVPEEFSRKVCKAIPGSIAEIARSGLIDGEIMIARRVAEGEDPVVTRIDGEHCVEQAKSIGTILEDRINGATARKETDAHFAKQREDAEKAKASLEMGSDDLMVEQYFRPANTWLKETEGALAYYAERSGLTEPDKITEWIIREKIIPEVRKSMEDDSKKELNQMFEESDDKQATAENDLDSMFTDQEMVAAGVKTEGVEGMNI